MKKLILSSIIALVAASSSFASAELKEPKAMAGEVEKKGFLVTEECAKKGYFKDCRLETLQTSPMALYVHSEGVTYRLDTSDTTVYKLDENIGRNNVTIIGSLGQDNVIKVRTFKAPPPEGKSFFKGCL